MKVIASMAIVTTRPLAYSAEAMPPAASIWLKTQPPKISPLALVSAGMAATRTVSSPRGSTGTGKALSDGAVAGFKGLASAAECDDTLLNPQCSDCRRLGSLVPARARREGNLKRLWPNLTGSRRRLTTSRRYERRATLSRQNQKSALSILY